MRERCVRQQDGEYQTGVVEQQRGLGRSSVQYAFRTTNMSYIPTFGKILDRRYTKETALRYIRTLILF
jgi:hypothetical protein